MANIFTDGFDKYAATADFPDKGWTNGDATNITFQSTAGRFGGGAVDFRDDGGFGLRRSVSLNEDRIRLACWIFMKSTAGIQNGHELFRFTENATNNTLEIQIATGGFIGVSDYDDDTTGNAIVTGTKAINDDQFHHFEIHFVPGTIGVADGTIETWIDGVKDIDQVASVITRAVGSGTFQNLDIMDVEPPTDVQGTTGDYKIDDLVVWDDAAGGMTGRLNQHRIETLTPTAEGNLIQFTPQSGVDNALMVDETAQDGDTTWVESAVAANQDTYVYDNLVANPSSIKTVVVNTVARNTDIGAINFDAVARSNAVEANSVAQAITGSFVLYQHEFSTDPSGGGAWTIARIDAAEFGLEVS